MDRTITAQVRPLKVSLDPAKGPINLATGVTPQMTTDGRVLVRQQGGARTSGNSFYLITPADGAAELVCTTLAPIGCTGPMTGDGRFKLGRDESTQRLLLFDRSKAGAPSRLTNDFADEDRPFLSPDGRVALFASNPTVPGRFMHCRSIARRSRVRCV